MRQILLLVCETLSGEYFQGLVILIVTSALSERTNMILPFTGKRLTRAGRGQQILMLETGVWIDLRQESQYKWCNTRR